MDADKRFEEIHVGEIARLGIELANRERLLKGTSYLIDEANGAGHIVLFAEDPFFRGMTRGLTRQFFNAIAFAGTF